MTGSLDIPATSTAAVFLGASRPLELHRFAVPGVEAGEALVRVDLCTLCGSDLHTLTGARREPVPTILGHEILGTVVQVGAPPPGEPGGRPLQPGDRVTWSIAVSCGKCDRCRGALPQKCRGLAKYGHERAEGRWALSGGLSEYVLLRPGSSPLRLEPDLDPKSMCPVNCGTATVAAAFRAAGETAQRRVLIFGAGLLGLTAAAVARTGKSERVIVCDPQSDRRELATRFGADAAIPWSDDVDLLQQHVAQSAKGDRFDVVLECSGSPQAVEAALRFADIGARIVLLGSVLPTRDVRVDPESMVRRLLTITGVHNYVPDDLRTAVDFVQRFQQRFPFDSLVEATFPLEQINEAVRFAVDHRPIRVAVRP